MKCISDLRFCSVSNAILQDWSQVKTLMALAWLLCLLGTLHAVEHDTC